MARAKCVRDYLQGGDEIKVRSATHRTRDFRDYDDDDDEMPFPGTALGASGNAVHLLLSSKTVVTCDGHSHI